MRPTRMRRWLPMRRFLSASRALAASPRWITADGSDQTTDPNRRAPISRRLHRAPRRREARLSRANVCDYAGAEIPNWRALGLGPDRIYRLYRDADELAAASASFNNLPLIRGHYEVSADDPRKDLVIGATGSNARFDSPFLTNSLVVWDGAAINEIQTGERAQLSAAYRFRADMTPGTTRDGERYDGIMRDISASLLALVQQGRVAGAVIADGRAITAAPWQWRAALGSLRKVA